MQRNHPFFKRDINTIPVNIHIPEAEFLANEAVIKPTIVDRGSLMTATDVLGIIPPGGDFHIEAPTIEAPESPIESVIDPLTVTFKAKWYTADEKTAKTGVDANTFGESGTLELIDPPDTLTLQAIDSRGLTTETLAAFGATLTPINEPIRGFNTSPYPLAVVTYRVHADYTKEYLFKPNGGGGAFIERHVPPHVWAPLNPDCTGALILGQRTDDQYRLLAVNIPFGYALSLQANALHADAFLVGNYAMALSATEDKNANASTVVFRTPNDEIQPVEVISVPRFR